MKFRIHFEINGGDDDFDVEGDSLEDVKIKTDLELKRRGLSVDENGVWSQEL